MRFKYSKIILASKYLDLEIKSLYELNAYKNGKRLAF
jgi:hypothetical protein